MKNASMSFCLLFMILSVSMMSCLAAEVAPGKPVPVTSAAKQVRSEVQNKDGSISVKLPDGTSYQEKKGLFTVYDVHNKVVGTYVDASRVHCKLPNTKDTKGIGCVDNQSDEPILVGAFETNPDAKKGPIRIYLLLPHTKTEAKQDPDFVVTHADYQPKHIDGKLLIPANFPADTSVYKLAVGTLEVTNENWGYTPTSVK
jgi:hypothetical protein